MSSTKATRAERGSEAGRAAAQDSAPDREIQRPAPIADLDDLLRTQEVVDYLHWLCHLLDRFEIDVFVEEFVDDGHYRLIPRENYDRGLFVHIIDDTKDRLRYRRDIIQNHWHFEAFRETRSLSNTLVRFPTANIAETTSNFAIHHTTAEGATRLHLVGVFEDTLVRWDGRWRIKDRLAILETFSPDEAIVVPP